MAPEAFDDVAASISTSGSEATSDFPTEDSTVSVVLDAASSTVTIQDESKEPVVLTLVGGSSTETGSEVTADGSMHSAHVAGVSSTSLIKEGGSVQIISTIADASSSTRIPYEFDSPSLASIEEAEGTLVLRDDEGGMLGGVAPAWAKDANGVEVPTRYEVSGLSITQIVEHQSGEYAYPIVADPFWGTNLFDYVLLGNNEHILKPSGWGRAIQNGVVGGHGVGETILMNDGWAEFLNRTPGPQWVFPTVRQQYACHVRYARIDWVGGETWGLEITRPVVSPDSVTYEVWRHECNWNYSNGDV